MKLPPDTHTIVIGTKVAPGHYVAGKSFDSLEACRTRIRLLHEETPGGQPDEFLPIQITTTYHPPTMPDHPEPDTPTNASDQDYVRHHLEKEIVANKTLRRDLDAMIQQVKRLPSSRERNLAITKLQEAVMWLGMDLKRINEACPGIQDNPYPDSKNPDNLKIDPTADGLKL